MRTAARFPELEQRDGHYESFYLKAAAPGGGRAIWIRLTVHKRSGSEPTCAVWFTLFDRAAPAPRAAKASFGTEELSTPDGSYVRVDGAEIAPGRVEGEITTETLAASWTLSYSDRHDALRHLPSEWMYHRPLPRTKVLSPHPGALFSGELRVDGETIELDGWPGMVGHNWGAEHAERWVWIQASDFDGGEPGDYLDIAGGRIKLGPWTVPWIANGRLVLGGRPHRLGGLPKVRRTEIAAEPTACRFTLPGEGITVRGTVGAPVERFVGWLYADPEGPEHNALNCSISDLEIEVERPGEPPVQLVATGSATYEIGMRETDHGVPIQPYPDG